MVWLKIGLAITVAGALALGTNASFEMALRYLAAISGIGSLAQAAVAITKHLANRGGPSDWYEVVVLVAISAGGHFVAGLVHKT